MRLQSRSMRLTGVQFALVSGVALTQSFLPRPALAQGTPSILPTCLTALEGDVQRDGQTGRLLTLRAERVADTDDGILVFVPADCFGQQSTDVAPPDANAIARNAVEDVRNALVEQGAPPAAVESAFRSLDQTLELQDFQTAREAVEVFDDLGGARTEQFGRDGSDDSANSAMAAMAVAACIGLTGGAACAALPVLMGSLFGTDVTTTDLETALQVSDSMRGGHAIPPEAREHLRRRGVDENLIDVADSFAQGNLDDVIRSLGTAAGLHADEVDMIEVVVEAARTGQLSCEFVREAARGRLNRPLLLDAQRRRDLRSTVARALALHGGAPAVASSEAALECFDQLLE